MTEGPARQPARLFFTSRFRRQSSRLAPDAKQTLARALRIFRTNPADPRLRLHKLSGQFENSWAFAFGYDARVVFRWDGNIAVLLDVGSHNEVYG